MNGLEHFQRLFAYDEWANREVLASLRGAAAPPAIALERIAHILSAQYVWFDRLKQQRQTLPVWPSFTLEQSESEAAKLVLLWKDYLSTMEAGFDATITYKNTIGESWTSRIEDVLTHVIMHSAYHRGQIAADLRAGGFTPAYTDFIHGIRQGFVEWPGSRQFRLGAGKAGPTAV